MFCRRAGTLVSCFLIASWTLAARGPMQTGASPQPVSPASDPHPSADVAAERAVLQRYCLTCHNQKLKEQGIVPIALDTLDVSKLGGDAQTWERVVRKIRTGLMPPPGRPRPDTATYDRFAAWLETELDRAAAASPNPGRTEPLHRLNRAEYQNVLRDLLHLEVNVASLLPADDASYGFDNIAGVLKMSPTLMDRYLAAAQKVSRLAIGTPPLFPNVDDFHLADDLPQDDHLDGLPIGTRGGTSIRYTFPMDAEYVIRVRLARDVNESVPVYAEPQQLEVSLDGERLQLFTLPGVSSQPAQPQVPPRDPDLPQASPPQSGPPAPQTRPLPQSNAGGQPPSAQRPRPQISQVDQVGPRLSPAERQLRNHADDNWDVHVRVKAGVRDLKVTFVKMTSAIDETARLPFVRPYGASVNIAETRKGAHLRSVEIAGPYAPSGPGDSPSRRRIFVCQPTSRRASRKGGLTPGGGGPAAASRETGCARTILSTLARRAYRRPVTDADLEPLLAMYTEGRREGGFDLGLERAVKRLLVSPEFLFRVERDPANVAPDTPYRISDLELASRLSFFLWSSIPDDELLDAAVSARLRDPAELARQVRRMIADDRSGAFVKNFAGQWLYLRNLPATAPVQTAFPDFDDTLRQAFQRETELFFESIVREDRGALELLTADYTFLNERLARHYGIPHITGSHFRRVTLGRDSLRGGLLGQGSILTVTSHPDRTSPVVRGKWILENLLGASPPPPPPNVPELKPTSEPGKVLSMRDRMVQHRENPACASCHAIMDPLGLSLENLDGVGRARTLGESSEPIDASGVLPDGTKFTGPAGLKQALLTRSDEFVTTLTEKLLTYALGRGLEYYDAPAVRAVVRDARPRDFRFSSLIAGIVESAPFQMRMGE
jgi:mono/diheme cytochrome c family protein